MSARAAAVVVEDEPLARGKLRELLAEAPWIECAGEAGDGREAVRLIDRLRPDVVFLDVHLPEASGLEVLDRIDHDPLVVFTTAFDRYAVTAFEREAVDYLVKPFGAKRFHATLERVRLKLEAERAAAVPPAAALAAGAGGEGVGAGAGGAGAGGDVARRPLLRLFARKGPRIVPLPVAAVARFEAEGERVIVHCGGETYSTGLSLNQLEARLDPERFRRVHRAHLVNLDQVAAMQLHERRMRIRLKDGSTVGASRAATRWLRRVIE